MYPVACLIWEKKSPSRLICVVVFNHQIGPPPPIICPPTPSRWWFPLSADCNKEEEEEEKEEVLSRNTCSHMGFLTLIVPFVPQCREMRVSKKQHHRGHDRQCEFRALGLHLHSAAGCGLRACDGGGGGVGGGGLVGGGGYCGLRSCAGGRGRGGAGGAVGWVDALMWVSVSGEV